MIPNYVTIGGASIDWVINAGGLENRMCCGGNALYSAVGAKFWDESIAIVTRIGKDYPKEYLDAFVEAGIEVNQVKLPINHKKPRPVYYDKSGARFEKNDECSAHFEQSIPGRTITDFDPKIEDLPEKLLLAKGFHLAPMPLFTQYSFAKLLFNKTIPVSLDPRKNIVDDDYLDLLRHTKYFLPSEVDIKEFMIGSTFEEKIKKLSHFGPSIVVIKLGNKGSIIYNQRSNKLLYFPVYPSEVKDLTGAGDAFCGGFITGIIETDDPIEAVIRATVSASLVIEAFDARYGLCITKHEINKRYRYLKEYVKYNL